MKLQIPAKRERQLNNARVNKQDVNTDEGKDNAASASKEKESVPGSSACDKDKSRNKQEVNKENRAGEGKDNADASV